MLTSACVPSQCDPALLPEPNHVMLNHLYALSIKVMTCSLLRADSQSALGPPSDPIACSSDLRGSFQDLVQTPGSGPESGPGSPHLIFPPCPSGWSDGAQRDAPVQEEVRDHPAVQAYMRSGGRGPGGAALQAARSPPREQTHFPFSR